jgi:hypothetical protein
VKTVETSGREGRLRRGGAQPRMWAYGYADLAALFGMREGAVRAAVARGKLVPGDLRSVAGYLRSREVGR